MPNLMLKYLSIQYFPNTVVSPILTEDIKIYQIVMNAKELQKDIVTELHQNGFNISEVAI